MSSDVISLKLPHTHWQQFRTSHTETAGSSQEKLLWWIVSSITSFMLHRTISWDRKKRRQIWFMTDMSPYLIYTISHNHILLPNALQIVPHTSSNDISESQQSEYGRRPPHHWFLRTEPTDTNLSVSCSFNSPKNIIALWLMLAIYIFSPFCCLDLLSWYSNSSTDRHKCNNFTSWLRERMKGIVGKH